MEIQTYHCLCSQLLVATTTSLSSCARRAGESIDKAFILPLTASGDGSDVERAGSANQVTANKSNYSELLHTNPDRKPITIRRADGFESRYQQRCTRCNLVIGYQLENTQYDDQSQLGRREDVVYILPGALLTTAEMIDGKETGAT
jgi:hypothetical protein